MAQANAGLESSWGWKSWEKAVEKDPASLWVKGLVARIESP